jgi:inhibitor of KinA sporulation pathway (predicted exonuclease)
MSSGSLPLDEFLRLATVVLLDCEFTCWEDSLSTRWSDPSRPPELIEIGLVEYDARRDRVGSAFTSLVRPRFNPSLSPYCKRLLGISQAEIDRAPSLVEVLPRLGAWLASVGLSGAPVCEWGTGDLPALAQDAARCGSTSPFHAAPHVDLGVLYQRVFGERDRDAARKRFSLRDNRRRHRALPDALDLQQFCALLRKTADGS